MQNYSVLDVSSNGIEKITVTNAVHVHVYTPDMNDPTLDKLKFL